MLFNGVYCTECTEDQGYVTLYNAYKYSYITDIINSILLLSSERYKGQQALVPLCSIHLVGVIKMLYK